jgi:hypothetical protein
MLKAHFIEISEAHEVVSTRDTPPNTAVLTWRQTPSTRT